MIKIKVIAPRGVLLDARKMARAIENALDGAALAAKADFGVTQQTWSDESKARFKVTRKPGMRAVGTSDTPYVWVSRGTKPHEIRAKNKKVLAFPRVFRAKTRVREIKSWKGYKNPKARYFRKSVRHPGIKAREFDAAIAEKWNEKLPTTLQRALDAEVE